MSRFRARELRGSRYDRLNEYGQLTPAAASNGLAVVAAILYGLMNHGFATWRLINKALISDITIQLTPQTISAAVRTLHANNDHDAEVRR